MSGLQQRQTRLETAHSQLVNLINNVVMPNVRSVMDIAGFARLNEVVARHTVYMSIIIERLKISEQDYQEAKARLANAAAKGTEQLRVQSSSVGSDAHRDADGQSRVLDAASGGESDNSAESSGVREDGQGSSVDTEHPAAGSGEGQTFSVKGRQMGMNKAHLESLKRLKDPDV